MFSFGTNETLSLRAALQNIHVDEWPLYLRENPLHKALRMYKDILPTRRQRILLVGEFAAQIKAAECDLNVKFLMFL